jgi:hypothetical protein
MKKYHYVYHSYEEWGRDYIGVRSCNCLPEEDTKYFGSFKDKTFSPTEKTILFVCETRKEAAEIEIELHDFFDVAVNPKFANQAKATSTKFDTTGVTAGPRTKEWKQAQSERVSGKNHPQFGVPHTEGWKKAMSEKMSGRYLGALSPCSKAIIAIQPDGIELHFEGVLEAARDLKINPGNLSTYLKTGKSPKWGKFKG